MPPTDGAARGEPSLLELSRVVTDEAEGNNTCTETFELVGILGIAESLGYYIVKDQHHLVVEANRRKRASKHLLNAENSLWRKIFPAFGIETRL